METPTTGAPLSPPLAQFPPLPPVPPPPRQAEVPQAVLVADRVASVAQIVRYAYGQKASDIHIRVGEVPRMRIRGKILPIPGHPPVTPAVFQKYLTEVLPPRQRQQFAETKELDTALVYPNFLRCRVNCFEALTGGAMVLRLISLEVPSISSLQLPEVLADLVHRPQGLILVTGPTGSGKSTTLAAMVQELNQTAHKHIVTIEDPIEYVHQSKNCLISQREVGLHTYEFHQALRSVLREDPDVILVGEMRDRETVDTALKAAQTGHLVLGTLHTRNALNTINRLLNIYPPDEQPAMRTQIVESLVAIVAQQLLATTDGQRTVASEILLNTPTMQDYLLKGNETEAFELMATNTAEGMRIMNQSLCELMLLGRITPDEATRTTPDLGDLRRRVRNHGYDPARSANRLFHEEYDYRPL